MRAFGGEGGRGLSRYYPYGIFCDKYGCWCDDVVDITDGNNECNGDCSNCQYSAKPTKI